MNVVSVESRRNEFHNPPRIQILFLAHCNFICFYISGVWARTKKRIFKWARIIPSVRNRIDSELAKTEENFKNDILKSTKGLDYLLKLPYEGKKTAEILTQLDNHLALGSYNWKGGKVSGAVYNFDEEVIDLLTKVYAKTMLTNPLHADLFPGVCKMEAEVIRMTATLFNGDAEACGTVRQYLKFLSKSTDPNKFLDDNRWNRVHFNGV